MPVAHRPMATLFAALLAALLAGAASAQTTEAGVVGLRLDTRLMPTQYAVGGGASLRVHSGLSAFARARQLFVTGGDCTELSPTPCNPEGFGWTVGLHLTSPDLSRSFPYLEVAAGRYRYSDGLRKPLLTVGAGLRWRLADRGSLRIGLEYERIDADPAYWPTGASAHDVAGIIVGFDVGVG